METISIAREIALLPSEAQKQVLDFVAFLKTRYPTIEPAQEVQNTMLTEEPFVGMWRDREDMRDSTAWVRNLRRHEWERAERVNSLL